MFYEFCVIILLIMPRGPRVDVGDYVYHVINRAAGRRTIFPDSGAYRSFEDLLIEGQKTWEMPMLAYVIMPNHWHMLVYPRKDGDMGKYFHWLTTTHACRLRAFRNTIGEGPVYQGRYKSFLVDTDAYVLTALKYIECNPVRAGLVETPEEWKWGSAHRRIFGTEQERALLAPPPVPLPDSYRVWINAGESEEALRQIRGSVSKGIPFGDDVWRDRMITKFVLKHTTRPAGRPKIIK